LDGDDECVIVVVESEGLIGTGVVALAGSSELFEF
jgi:hypothetical protein